MSRGRVLLVGVLCAIAGTVLGAVVAHRTSLGRPQYASIDQALVSADGMTIATSGGCFSGPLGVTETATAVTLRLPASNARVQGVCAIGSFTVRLKAPLGNRTLVDAATGRTVPAFSGARILRPAHLPAHFTLAYDTANFTDRGGDQPSGPGCIQVYIKDGEYDDTLLVAQIVNGTPDLPDGVRGTAITVHGHSGIAIPGEIEWTENGQLFTITSMTYAYAVLATADLVAIGNSLP